MQIVKTSSITFMQMNQIVDIFTGMQVIRDFLNGNQGGHIAFIGNYKQYTKEKIKSDYIMVLL